MDLTAITAIIGLATALIKLYTVVIDPDFRRKTRLVVIREKIQSLLDKCDALKQDMTTALIEDDMDALNEAVVLYNKDVAEINSLVEETKLYIASLSSDTTAPTDSQKEMATLKVKMATAVAEGDDDALEKAAVRYNYLQSQQS